jgi:hypothetical protein
MNLQQTLKDIKMENQVEWIKVKKITPKENRIAIIKFFAFSILLFTLVYGTFIFGIQLIPMIWKSDLLQTAAEWLRYLVK